MKGKKAILKEQRHERKKTVSQFKMRNAGGRTLHVGGAECLEAKGICDTAAAVVNFPS